MNGSIKDITNYIHNKKDGEYKSFYDDGTLEKTGQYYADRRVGTWNTYDLDGSLLLTFDNER